MVPIINLYHSTSCMSKDCRVPSYIIIITLELSRKNINVNLQEDWSTVKPHAKKAAPPRGMETQ